MKTIHFNQPLVTVNGTPHATDTLGKILSEVIGHETEGKTLKLYGWHKTLQVGDPLLLDDSDLKDLTELIEKNKMLFMYVKGQLLEVINKTQ